MALDEGLQLADQLAVPSEREVGVDPLLERGQAELLEASDLRLGERLVREVGEGRPAPERERVTEPIGCQLRVVPAERLSSLLEPALERGGVERLGSDAQDVSVPVRFEPRGLQPRRPRPASAFRSRETYACSVFAAVVGGLSPQRSSMSASCDTTSFARRRRAASSARCLGPPRSSLRPSSTTSSGPRIRNSIAAPDPPSSPHRLLRARRPAHGATDCRRFAADSQPLATQRSLHRPPSGGHANGGGAMLHPTVKRLTTGAAVAVTRSSPPPGPALRTRRPPDDRATHGPGPSPRRTTG